MLVLHNVSTFLTVLLCFYPFRSFLHSRTLFGSKGSAQYFKHDLHTFMFLDVVILRKRGIIVGLSIVEGRTACTRCFYFFYQMIALKNI